MSKIMLWVLGVVFIIVGLLGWVPNPLVGMGAVFDTNHVHDAVHLLFGVVFIIVAIGAANRGTMTLKIAGAIYLLLAIIGFVSVPGGGEMLGIVQTNMADHWLHVVLGVVILGLGFITQDEPRGDGYLVSN